MNAKFGFLLLAITITPLGWLAGNEPAAGYEEPEIETRDLRHWAWRPAQDHPERQSIDEFLLEKLQQSEIQSFAPPAGKGTLLRRLHLTLTGLPPTPGEVRSFQIDHTDAVVDDLLSRASYGEHWAQHWLDLARFAETDGFEHDKIRPEAWRYRDWVIDALNRDLPYDRFLALQIAGDEIGGLDSPDRYATGFLLAGPDMPDINLEEERRHNVLNETTSAVGSAFLGLTLGCAQCHDHKTDPISIADFYRLRSFFGKVSMPKKNASLPAVFPEGKSHSANYLYNRGDFRRPLSTVEPAFLRIINPDHESPEFQSTSTSSGQRTALAARLTDPTHPLVARVIVNRIWQQHFGKGLVATPNDFGKTGEKPSHPELLDWLAHRFVKNGWSLKQLHRVIVLSEAWRQTSFASEIPDFAQRIESDPDNQLLSRRVPVRLTGEMIRDGMLAASGTLNRKSGGPGVRPPLPAEVTVTLLKNQWEVTPDEKEHYRRSIYLFVRRNLRYPLFEVFDKPDANLPCGRRHPSTTAPQSLTLLNSAFSAARASDLAKRLSTEANADSRIETAFLLTLGRLPDEDELSDSKSFIQRVSLEDFTLSLFNLNEFVHID